MLFIKIYYTNLFILIAVSYQKLLFINFVKNRCISPFRHGVLVSKITVLVLVPSLVSWLKDISLKTRLVSRDETILWSWILGLLSYRIIALHDTISSPLAVPSDNDPWRHPASLELGSDHFHMEPRPARRQNTPSPSSSALISQPSNWHSIDSSTTTAQTQIRSRTSLPRGPIGWRVLETHNVHPAATLVQPEA